MIDFHTHSLLSDGELLPSELARRAEAKGYRAVGIADHVDFSNVDFVIPRLLCASKELRDAAGIDVIAGAEITHIPPPLIAALARRCRELGAEFLIVHGETLAEPVLPGTNDAALQAQIDILAHPGLLTPDQARMAASRGILLEISCRAGHCLANGLVARRALAASAQLVIGSDAHSPCDLVGVEAAMNVARGAGLSEEEAVAAMRSAELLWERIRKERSSGQERQVR